MSNSKNKHIIPTGYTKESPDAMMNTSMIKHLADHSAEEEYDLCIIGSGPAGLTLAHELAESGQTICVLESGSIDLAKGNHTQQELKKVTSLGEIIIKNHSRERALGGTSNTWTGLSAPLDPIDLERWPIPTGTLDHYYARLDQYGFAPLKEFSLEQHGELKKAANLGNWKMLEEKVFIASVPPVNFGKKYYSVFEGPNIDLYLDTTVTKILTNRERTRVVGVAVADSGEARSAIKAKKVVICAGGLESIRLLLISDGLGNGHDQVGRYLMNHPKGTSGILQLRRPLEHPEYFFGFDVSGMSGYVGLRIRESLQQELGLLNSYLRLEPVISRSFFSRLFRKLGYHPPVTTLQTRNFMDMEPHRENRLFLGKEKDPYGNPLPVVSMSTTEQDRNSLIKLHELFAQEMEAQGLGTFTSNLSVSPWPIILDASHHLGGTIMGFDEKTSVVDPDLKIHSIENLYVCSSSVFPTAGCANPTYTICALAVRLADHLRSH